MELITLMEKLPPDYNEIKNYLEKSKLSSQTITETAFQFIYNDCHFERDQNKLREKQHGTYLYGLINLLLEYELDPNGICEDYSLMRAVSLVDTDYNSADTIGLLLAHGGNLYLENDGEALFDEIEFDVIFGAHNQENRELYDQWVHTWLVMIGYGAESLLSNGERKNMVRFYEPPCYDEPHTPFTIERFKEHRNFTWALTHVPGNGEKWTLHIIDKETGWEVLRL